MHEYVSSRNLRKYRNVSTRKKICNCTSGGQSSLVENRILIWDNLGLYIMKESSFFILILLCVIFWVGKLYNGHI